MKFSLYEIGITGESQIQATISAYAGSLGFTPTEEEIAKIVADIQGMSGTSGSGSGISETVVSAYSTLMSTDDQENMIYMGYSDDLLKNILTNMGYSETDAQKAIERFRETIGKFEENAEQNLQQTIDQSIKSNENYLTSGTANSLIEILGYAYGSEEANRIIAQVQEQNGKLIDKLISINLNIDSDAGRQIVERFAESVSEWDNMTYEKKLETIKNFVIASAGTNDISTEARDKFLVKYYCNGANSGLGSFKKSNNVFENAGNEKKGAEELRSIADSMIQLANETGGMNSYAVIQYASFVMDKLKNVRVEYKTTFGMKPYTEYSFSVNGFDFKFLTSMDKDVRENGSRYGIFNMNKLNGTGLSDDQAMMFAQIFNTYVQESQGSGSVENRDPLFPSIDPDVVEEIRKGL